LLVAAVVAVVIVASGIAAGSLLSDDDDPATTATGAAPTAVSGSSVPTTVIPTTGAPSATVAGTRYRDEIFKALTIERDVQYGSAPGADGAPVALLLDVYQPAGDELVARPALVWVHGGGFRNGDKAAGPAAIMAPLFAKLGYVVVSINYRLLAPESCTGVDGVSPSCFDAAIQGVHDGQAAVRWLRLNAQKHRIDVDRIGIGGESAGAIIATGVGVYADAPGESGNPGFASTVAAWVSISGGVPGGLFVDATDAPGLLISGTADDVVPYQWSLETANALQAAGVANRLTTLPDAGHVPFLDHGAQMQTESIAFLYDHLHLAAA
jgi:acetyl esterase/lipase